MIITLFVEHLYSDHANANGSENDATVFERIVMKIGCFRDIRLVGNVAFMQIGPN